MGNLALVDQEFEFEGSRIDSIMYGGKPYWIARDIGDLIDWCPCAADQVVR